MLDRAQLDGLSAPLRARFDRLSAEQQARVLSQLADSRRRRRGTRLVLNPLVHDPSPATSRRPPLVVLPSMFGNVDDWRRLAGDVVRDRAVYGIEIDGTDPYWTPHPSLEAIAARAVALIQQRLPGSRLHLAGYSFGGRLAYEVGQQLFAAHRVPMSIVVVDATAGTSPRRLGWRDLASMVANVGPWLRNEWSYYGPRDLAARLWRRWRFRGGGDRDDDRLNQVFLLSRFPALYQERLRQSRRAATAYRATESSNRVFYLRSRIRSLIHVHEPDGGWGALVARGRLTVLALPSDHGSALHPRWRPALRTALATALDAADPAPPGHG